MCEEFLEVVTCAVAIDWPTKKQDVHLKSDLDVLNHNLHIRAAIFS